MQPSIGTLLQVSWSGPHTTGQGVSQVAAASQSAASGFSIVEGTQIPPRSQPVVESAPRGQCFSSELQTIGHLAGQTPVDGMQVSGMGHPSSPIPPAQRTSPGAQCTGHAAWGQRGSCLMHWVPRSQPLLSTPKGQGSSPGIQVIGQTAGQLWVTLGSGSATHTPSDAQVSPPSVRLLPGQAMWSAGQ